MCCGLSRLLWNSVYYRSCYGRYALTRLGIAMVHQWALMHPLFRSSRCALLSVHLMSIIIHIIIVVRFEHEQRVLYMVAIQAHHWCHSISVLTSGYRTACKAREENAK